MVGLAGSIGIMIVEMLLFIGRSVRIESSLEGSGGKKVKKGVKESIGGVKLSGAATELLATQGGTTASQNISLVTKKMQ